MKTICPMVKIGKLILNDLYISVVKIMLFIAFFIRVYNLNYNAPYKDEATILYVGRFGLFQGDWTTLDPASWMPSHPFVDPLLSAAAYISNGIIGSRLLNVIIGVLLIEIIMVITALLTDGNAIKKYTAGIIAGVILTFSPVSLYISRISTYDIKSFYFLFLSILILIWISRQSTHIGKWYFLSSIFLMLSVLAKNVILIYVPLIFLYSYFKAMKSKDHFYFWKMYFLTPFIVMFSAYFIWSWKFLTTYFKEQVASNDPRDYSTIFTVIDNAIIFESG